MPRTNAKNPATQVSRKDFIETLFRTRTEGNILLVTQIGAEADATFPARLYTPRSTGGATHLPGATYGPLTTKAGNPSRVRSNVVEVPLLTLDDFGSKGHKALKVKATAVLETSPGNFTAYLRMNPPATLEQAETILNSLSEGGYMDPNCADAERVNRLPGSKPEDKKHEAVIAVWEPEIEYDPATFLKVVNVSEVAASRVSKDGSGNDPHIGVPIQDSVLEWLEDAGHLLGPDSDGRWHVITCPWHGAHSSPTRTVAKYRPATEGNWTRAFYCHHTHKEDTKDFLAWVAAQGGPEVDVRWSVPGDLDDLAVMLKDAGSTMREDLHEAQVAREEARDDFQERVLEALDRYVLYRPKNQVFDLRTAPNYPLHVLAGLKAYWKPWDDIIIGGRGGVRRVNVMDVWNESAEKMTTDSIPIMDPRLPSGWTGSVINTYEPFVPSGTVRQEHIDAFQRFVGHVVPENTEYMLDWMAYKLQNPEARMVAIINYTPTFGTGRNSLHHIMRLMLGEANCVNISASKLFGDNSNQFNVHLMSILATVAEVEEGKDISNRTISAGIFNKLKEMCDPDEQRTLIERKGLDGIATDIFTSFLVATNAGGGVPIQAGDRRFTVLRGARQPLLDAHPDLETWLTLVRDAKDSDALASIHSFLMARDVSAFNPRKILHTTAKDDMIDNRKLPVDRAIEEVLRIGEEDEYTVYTHSILHDRVRHFKEVAVAYDGREIDRQVAGWVRANSEPPAWLKSKGKDLKVDGIKHRPRVKSAVPTVDEHRDRNELLRFIHAPDATGIDGVVDFYSAKNPPKSR